MTGIYIPRKDNIMNITTTMIEELARVPLQVSQFLLDDPMQITRCEDAYALYNKSAKCYEIYQPVYELKNNKDIEITMANVDALKAINPQAGYWNEILKDKNISKSTNDGVAMYCNVMTVSCALIQIYVAYIFKWDIDPFVRLPRLNSNLMKIYQDNKFTFDAYLTTVSKIVSNIMYKYDVGYGILITMNIKNGLWEPETNFIGYYNEIGYIDLPKYYNPFIKPYHNYDVVDKGFLYITLYMMAMCTVVGIDSLDYRQPATRLGMEVEYICVENDTALKYASFYVPGPNPIKLRLSSNIFALNKNFNRDILEPVLQAKVKNVAGRMELNPLVLCENIVNLYEADSTFFDVDFCKCEYDATIENEIAKIINGDMVVIQGSSLSSYKVITHEVATIFANSFRIFKISFLLAIGRVYEAIIGGNYGFSSFSSPDDAVDFIFNTWKEVTEVFIDALIDDIIGIQNSCMSRIDIQLNRVTLNTLILDVKKSTGKYDQNLIYKKGFDIPTEKWLENTHNGITINIAF